KIIQNESTSQVDRRRSDVQTNQESNQTTQTIQPKDRLGNKLRLETSKTEELVQEINRRIQKSHIRLMYGTDANDREIVVYQVHVEDLRLFKHIFDERE
ncbi:122_t:CDS:2, partial [Racocetra persica]